MTAALDGLSAISLFVEDLPVTKNFYKDVFKLPIVFEDDSSVAFRIGNLIVNLLRVENAQDIVYPGVVATGGSGSRFQLSVWVKDADAVCAELRGRGLEILSGPRDRPWGMRTANFVDPAGHSWEIAQRLA